MPRGRRGAALTPEVLEEKQQLHESARAVAEQLPMNPPSLPLANFSARSEVHFLAYFFHALRSQRAHSPSRSNSH